LPGAGAGVEHRGARDQGPRPRHWDRPNLHARCHLHLHHHPHLHQHHHLTYTRAHQQENHSAIEARRMRRETGGAMGGPPRGRTMALGMGNPTIGMSRMAEYTCCSSAAFERPNANTFAFTTLHPHPLIPPRILTPYLHDDPLRTVTHHHYHHRRLAPNLCTAPH
jgi:hypothetical protein